MTVLVVMKKSESKERKWIGNRPRCQMGYSRHVAEPFGPGHVWWLACLFGLLGKALRTMYSDRTLCSTKISLINVEVDPLVSLRNRYRGWYICA